MIADDRPSSLITLEESIANEPKVPEHLRAPLLDDGSPDGSHIVNQEEK